MSSPARKIKGTESEQISTFEKKESKPKRLGLVWEQKKEQVIEDCKKKLPVLKETAIKAIITNKNQPTNLIIEGDNYHVLSALNYTHKKRIDVIYIDPPYNTGKKDWKYNNNFVDSEDAYRHSKWLSFMSERLVLAKKLLKENGVLICAIDYREKCRLGLLLEEIFTNKEKSCITILHNPRGKQSDAFSYVHEYAFFVHPKGKNIIQEKERSESVSNLRNWGGESLRTDAKNCFYPIIVEETSKGNIRIDRIGSTPPINFHPKNQTIPLNNKKYKVYPIDIKGIERKWRYSVDGVHRVIKSLKAVKEKNGRIEIKILKNREKYKTIWSDKKFDANEYGTKLVYEIINKKFPFPKSLYTIKECLEAICKNNPNAIILDFFAGSGTTGHAVLEMNKEDNGNRQFILCTNNESKICEEVTYPRINNVIKGYKFKGKEKKVLFEEKIDINLFENSQDFIEKIETYKSKHKEQYDSFKTEIDNKVFKLVGIKNINDKKEGLGGNLRYFKTDFINYNSYITDSLKMKITKNATELLCIKENSFEKIIDNKGFKIFKSNKHYVGIIFKDSYLHKFKEEIKKIDKSTSIYVFSLFGEGAFEKQFNNIKNIKVIPVPEAILKVYMKTFKSRDIAYAA